MKTDSIFKRFITILFASVIVFTLTATVALAFVAHRSINQRSMDRFEASTGAATNETVDRLEHYTNLLYSGRSFLNASVVVYQNEWIAFFNNQDMFTRYKGVGSISFIHPTTDKDKAKTLEKIRTLNSFTSPITIVPSGDRDSYGLVALVLNQTDSKKIIGYDVYADPSRKAVYDKAQLTGIPEMSAATLLANGKNGFFIALPVRADDSTKGAIALTLHTDELFPEIEDADSLQSSSVRITDVTNKSAPNELYRSKKWRDESKEPKRLDSVEIAGRIWQFEYQMKPDFTSGITQNAVPALVVVSGVFLTCVMALVALIILRLFLPKLGKPMSE